MSLRALALAIACAVATPACGPAAPPDAPKRAAEPAWQDIFDGTPSFFAVIRPQQMRRDPVYGRFFDALLRVAMARAGNSGVTAMDALAASDEIIIGITRHEDRHDDIAVVFKGVPSSLDPAKMTNNDGKRLLSASDEHSRVPEYELTDEKLFGSIFVLPGPTWVLTMGSARDRAKQAFATPAGRPVPRVDANALAVLQVDASVIGAKRPGLLTRHLQSATITLAPGKDGLQLTLHYAEEDGAARAEPAVKEVIKVLKDQDPKKWGWLEGATVSRQGNDVHAVVAPPAHLLEDLATVNPRDL